jgi:hypothetical protein
MAAAQENSSIEILLKRADRVYRPNEKIEGFVVVSAKNGWSAKSITMAVEGTIHLSTSGRVGLGLGNDTTSSSGQSYSLVKQDIEITSSGKFAEGATEIPFDFVLVGRAGQALLETYHGVYISVVYMMKVTCDRGMMKKALQKELEFTVEVSSGNVTASSPAKFEMTPQNLENVNATVLATIPKFFISGILHRSSCPINLPFTGEVTIGSCAASIRSVELQLARVETIVMEGQPMREATEIQNIQIGDGNIVRGLPVPMHMVFPRLFSCPTVISQLFKIEFEVNLIVVFGDGYMVTENFPIVLCRS